ncbi:MAG: hypothetical protein JO041_13715 [Acidobacteria bacterium]|nr:hypothetical protein [Acidobacteriota bacterium]
MKASLKYFGSVLIMGALMAPCGALAQDRDHDKDHDRDRKDRVYDRAHRDYHNWDENEDHAYRRWLDGRHEQYRDFNQLNASQQRAYWNWRHKHADMDRDRDHDHDHDHQ